jgi:hypothetical protein
MIPAGGRSQAKAKCCVRPATAQPMISRPTYGRSAATTFLLVYWWADWQLEIHAHNGIGVPANSTTVQSPFDLEHDELPIISRLFANPALQSGQIHERCTLVRQLDRDLSGYGAPNLDDGG